MELTTKIKIANTTNSTGVKVMLVGAGLVLAGGTVAIVGGILQDKCQEDLIKKRQQEIMNKLSNND